MRRRNYGGIARKYFTNKPIHVRGNAYLFCDEVANLTGKDIDFIKERCDELRKVQINRLQVAIPFSDVIRYLKRNGMKGIAKGLSDYHKRLIKDGAYLLGYDMNTTAKKYNRNKPV